MTFLDQMAGWELFATFNTFEQKVRVKGAGTWSGRRAGGRNNREYPSQPPWVYPSYPTWVYASYPPWVCSPPYTTRVCAPPYTTRVCATHGPHPGICYPWTTPGYIQDYTPPGYILGYTPPGYILLHTTLGIPCLPPPCWESVLSPLLRRRVREGVLGSRRRNPVGREPFGV